jgi:hypothetical protein
LDVAEAGLFVVGSIIKSRFGEVGFMGVEEPGLRTGSILTGLLKGEVPVGERLLLFWAKTMEPKPERSSVRLATVIPFSIVIKVLKSKQQNDKVKRSKEEWDIPI